MAAQHVAQQRAQVTGQFARHSVELTVDVQTGDRRAFHRRSVSDALREPRAVSGYCAECRYATRQAPGLRAFGLKQCPEGQQDLGQCFGGVGALEREVEAAQRPRDLAAARRAPADQAEERA